MLEALGCSIAGRRACVGRRDSIEIRCSEYKKIIRLLSFWQGFSLSWLSASTQVRSGLQSLLGNDNDV